MKRALSLLLLVSLVCAAESQSQTARAGTRVLRDLAYVAGGHERQKLDLYLPAGDHKRPLILWVHGGAWRKGDKRNCPARFLLEDGFAVASINYRLSQHARFPAQIEDCKAAIRWLRANAKRFGLDPERIGAWGSSAGGHLAALMGTSGHLKTFNAGEHLDQPSTIQAVCDFFGPTDFLRMNDFPSRIDHDAPDSPEPELIGGPIQQNKRKVQAANPITYVSRKTPPFLILHGDQDPLVPANQSQMLHDALKAKGATSTYLVIQGAGHGFRGRNTDKTVREFFLKTLMKQASADPR